MGNEMLLVSDSKRAYQLASSHSLPYFTFLSCCSYTGASGSSLGGISLLYIHQFYSASVFATKQVVSSMMRCLSGCSSNKLQIEEENKRDG